VNGVLALDLSQRTGWAYGRLDQPIPETGRWVLPDIGGRAARFCALHDMLDDHMERWKPIQMVIEAPLPPQAQTHTNSALQQYGLDAVVRMVGFWWGVPVVAIDSWTARHEVAGIRRTSDDTVKKSVFAFCRRLGIKVDSHDAADAAMLWLWFKRTQAA